MAVFRQIRLVLWKNFTIRRRRWPRVIFEILWPLCLFLILMWVRTRNLTNYYNNCHIDPKYLGSTGFLPALQTFVCRWNTSCHDTPEEGSLFERLANSSGQFDFLSQLFDTISVLSRDQEVLNISNQLVSEIRQLNFLNVSWNGFVKINRSQSDFSQPFPSGIVEKLFENPVNLSNLHQNWFHDRSSSLPNWNVALEILVNSFRTNFSYSYRNSSSVKKSFCDEFQFERTFSLGQNQSNSTKSFLCANLSSDELKDFLVSTQNQLDQFFTFNVNQSGVSLGQNLIKIGEKINELGQSMLRLNLSMNFNIPSINFSFDSICGGRNDLTSLGQTTGDTTNILDRSAKESRSTTTNTENPLIDLETLFKELMKRNESEICNQTYIVGSGSIKQNVIIERNCRCIVFDQTFQKQKVLRSVAKIIRPLLYGKIYYYPSNRVYDSLIKRLNEIFESLTEFVRFSRALQSSYQPWITNLATFCTVFPVESFCQTFNQTKTIYSTFVVLSEFIACSEQNRFVQMPTEEDLVTQGQKNALVDQFLAGIVFLDDSSNPNQLNKHTKFKIRMSLDHVDSTFRTENRYFTYQPRTYAPISTKYHSFGFIYLQNALERAIIAEQTGVNLSMGVQTQQMPYPCWIDDKFANAIRTMLPLFMVLSWIFTVSMNVKDIVYEKERRLKEIMRIMGLRDSVHWFTWFVLCASVMMFTAFLLVLILKFGRIIQYSNFWVLVLFLFCYTLATISQCFLISVLFNRANLAACGAGIIYFLLYLPYTVLLNYESGVKAWHKVVASLSSTVAFGLGCDYIARFEGMARGIQWSNINKVVKPNDNYTFTYCLVMMVFDAIFYFVLTIYIENVFPGEYGIPQRWYYPVTKTYWFGYDAQKIRERTAKAAQGQTSIDDEEDPVTNGEIGVEIRNISKYFRNKLALKNLSVKFYRNMITAYLGRNGAGKSTTWAILTGLIPPTSGTAFVDGYDILTDMKVVRKKLGFAPQHNILFDRLTVKEHLEFFSQLKGTSKRLIEEETEKMLVDLGLENKSSNYSTQLSGGMKRKLSIAIAFVGNSTTVILDEPTAGVDPFARRAIWDLILKYKTGRTIVLSTHHLDEADLLSDRLAIISSGELKCVGTTMFLKRKYGEGYHLIIETESTNTEKSIERSVTADENIVNPNEIQLKTLSSKSDDRFQDLTDFLKGYMSDIKVKEVHGDQVTYIILDDAEHTKVFPKMLQELDQNLQRFAIKTYGLSNSSLEQVFLRVADEVKRPEDYQRLSRWKQLQNKFFPCCVGKKKAKENFDSEHNENSDLQGEFNDEWKIRANERYNIVLCFFMQVIALLVKRFHRTKRNIKGLIAEILLPIIFVLLAMIVIRLVPNTRDQPQLILHPWHWGEPNYIFQALSSNKSSSILRSIQRSYTQSPSLGTRCMDTTMLDRNRFPCDAGQIGFVNVQPSDDVLQALNAVNYSFTRRSPDCDCNMKLQECPIGAGGPDPSYDKLETKDTLYSLSNYNITDWTIKTEFRDIYLMKRFGGIELFPPIVNRTISLFSIEYIRRAVSLFPNASINIEKLARLFQADPPQASIWYNNKGWPASVAFVNIFNNALLRGILLDRNPTGSVRDYGITAISHPLPQSDIQVDSELETQVALEMFTAICVIFALAFIPASFLVFLIDERATTSKHLQFVSGVKGFTYWWSNFLWDMTNYCFSITLCIIIFLGFGVEAYVKGSAIGCLILLLFLYGFAIIPMMYPISYLFKTPSTGFVLVSCINIFIGLISTIATITLENFRDEPDLQRINGILLKAFLIFPHYCLGRGLFDMSKTHTYNVVRQKYIENYQPVSLFEFNVVGRNLMALFIEGIFFFCLTILVEYRFFIPDRGCVRVPKDLKLDAEDNDVAEEREKIYSDPKNTRKDVLRMVDLTKVYGWCFGKKFNAVKQTCVGVRQGECFGLLGINGSGKSTTFKMLTGEISMTSGNAYVNNYSVIKQLDSVHRSLGYCPQFDALDSLLTAREHLYFYARIRGIKAANIPYVSDCLLKRLGLTLWADRPVRQYSGGNKRKLSTAISLIGNPSIIFMDEPTTGMDVRAKRFLWNSILTLTRKDNKSVIITSHSMEECETLCNRLVIMVNGQFKCLGSVQHLKTKFGDGYTILIRTNSESNTGQAISYVQEKIPGAIVREEHNKMIHFRVSSNVPLHNMFTVLETARDDLPNVIEDYTVTQVTLDDVFVTFAKGEKERHDDSTSNLAKKSFWRRIFRSKKNKNTVAPQ